MCAERFPVFKLISAGWTTVSSPHGVCFQCKQLSRRPVDNEDQSVGSHLHHLPHIRMYRLHDGHAFYHLALPRPVLVFGPSVWRWRRERGGPWPHWRCKWRVSQTSKTISWRHQLASPVFTSGNLNCERERMLTTTLQVPIVQNFHTISET